MSADNINYINPDEVGLAADINKYNKFTAFTHGNNTYIMKTIDVGGKIIEVNNVLVYGVEGRVKHDITNEEYENADKTGILSWKNGTYIHWESKAKSFYLVTVTVQGQKDNKNLTGERRVVFEMVEFASHKYKYRHGFHYGESKGVWHAFMEDPQLFGKNKIGIYLIRAGKILVDHFGDESLHEKAMMAIAPSDDINSTLDMYDHFKLSKSQEIRSGPYYDI